MWDKCDLFKQVKYCLNVQILTHSCGGFPGHFAGEDVKAKLAELHGRWDTLKAKASQRRQDLEDSLQAQQYFADANEAESWMREKEPIVGSTDYGKDEDSAEVNKWKGCRPDIHCRNEYEFIQSYSCMFLMHGILKFNFLNTC